MKPIVIYTFDYDEGSGGIKVMHKLCDMLNKNGYESYLTFAYSGDNGKICPDYNTPIAPPSIMNNLDEAIVLYPEGRDGNPLNAKNVVRWILNFINTGTTATWGENDLIYWYMGYYYNDTLGQKENILHLVEFHDREFINQHYNRQGSCYTIRKGINNPERFIHPEDSIEITYETCRDRKRLIDIFNKTERFYCYDDHTLLYTQAALCNCTSIVVPEHPEHTEKDKERWLNGSPLHKYGIAFDENDISRALETLPQMHKEIEQMKLEMNENVIKFAEHCQNYFK
jgi:hypothetical protein